jgi:drug/metabolite transporter (DMT)-like permease
MNEAKLKTNTHHALYGSLLFTLAIFLIVAMNAFAKAAMEYHTPIETLFYRSLIAMILLLTFAGLTKQKNIFKTKHPLKHFRRSLAGNIGVAMVFWSYALLPFADVTAILFLSPLIVTALSAVFLKEKVGAFRWGAVLIGFLGVIIIIGPTGESFQNIGVFVVLFAAFTVALVSVFLRDMGKTEDTLTTVFYFLAFGVFFSGIYTIMFGSAPADKAIIPLLGAGITGGIQLIIKTHAYKLAEASLLSPITYTSIIWATLFGWFFWDEIPTMPVFIGAFIVIISNLFIISREKQKTS